MEKRAKAAGRVSKDVLLDAPLPQATKTYTVISHKFVIDTIKEKLTAKGFVVTDEVYSATDGAQIAYGIFRINYGNDPELGMLFAFNNSYNKQLKFSCAVGAYVKTNETSILSKDGSAWIRMHTGTADDEAKETIEEQIENAEAYFNLLETDKAKMMEIPIDRRGFGELLGRLFVDAKLMGVEQISLAKKEYEKPSFNYSSDPGCLWTAYNHILVALAKSHPRTWMEQQKLVHYHMMTEFDLPVFDDDEVMLGDPSQTSLVDLVSQVEDAGVENVSDLPEEIPTQDELDEGVLPEAAPEVLSEDDYTEAEEIIEQVEMPVTRLMTKKEIVEEYGDILPAEKLKALGIDVKPELEEEKPKPTISMKDAIEKYGHLVSEEERELLPKGKGSTESIQILRDAYNLDQEQEAAPEPAEIPDILLKEDGVVDAPEEVLQEIVEEKVGEILKEEYVKNATDGKTTLPLTEERLGEVLNEIDEGMILPPDPNTAAPEIETPAGEGVVESVSDEVDVPDFFMSKADVVALSPDLDLEVGMVVSVGDEDCEIISIPSEEDGDVGLSTLTVDEPVDEEPTAEEIVSEIEDAQVPVAEDLSFDIGEPNDMPPAETMLRTQSSDVKDFDEIKDDELSEEEAAAIEKSMEIMNSKVELSPAEQAIRDAIETEVVDLYGAEQPFTYKLSGDQYNIALESGETFILTAEYIDSIKEPV